MRGRIFTYLPDDVVCSEKIYLLLLFFPKGSRAKDIQFWLLFMIPLPAKGYYSATGKKVMKNSKTKQTH